MSEKNSKNNTKNSQNDSNDLESKAIFNPYLKLI